MITNMFGQPSRLVEKHSIAVSHPLLQTSTAQARHGCVYSPSRSRSELTRDRRMSKHTTNPQDMGWTYQGSNSQSKVSFYEKDGVKMDYYYTTGTVKTSMDHPSQGRTQMFRRDLSEDQFQSVCQNPRYHTGQGYQTKSSKYYKY